MVTAPVTLRPTSHFASLSLVALGCLLAAPAGAQIDTVSRPASAPRADSLKPPIAPGRAFFYSLMLPGSAQNLLGRNRAAVGLLAVELASVAMIRESGGDVREARLHLGDSLVVSHVDVAGNLLPIPELERRRFEQVEVSSRRSHVEDWVALLLANHLFAAADAFVAASLWDVKARVALEGNRHQLFVMARIPW